MFADYSNSYPLTEAEFCALYHDIRRGWRNCGDIDDGEDSCHNQCNYLLAFDPEAINENNGCPAIFGIDCHAAVNEWCDGDRDSVPVEAYCKECAPAQLRAEAESRLAEENEDRRQTAFTQREQSEKLQKRQIARKEWIGLSAQDFETECTRLFEGLGFEARKCRKGPDGGIDISLRRQDKQGAAQCKALAGPCGVKPVREFYGVLRKRGFEFGYFIARSGFTREAEAFLRNLEGLVAWDVDDFVEQSAKVQG